MAAWTGSFFLSCWVVVVFFFLLTCSYFKFNFASLIFNEPKGEIYLYEWRRCSAYERFRKGHLWNFTFWQIKCRPRCLASSSKAISTRVSEAPVTVRSLPCHAGRNGPWQLRDSSWKRRKLLQLRPFRNPGNGCAWRYKSSSRIFQISFKSYLTTGFFIGDFNFIPLNVDLCKILSLRFSIFCVFCLFVCSFCFFLFLVSII